ncbi:hypothetical protein COP2_038270 [Malus domestica]
MRERKNYIDAIGNIFVVQIVRGGLGFRLLYAFNLGMLAKQWWRLLSDPHFLVATALKEKYFPNNSFMEALLNSGASYVWKSICTARKVLSLGPK